MSPLTDLTQKIVFTYAVHFSNNSLGWFYSLIRGPSYTIEINNKKTTKKKTTSKLLKLVQDNLQTRQRKVRDTKVVKIRQKHEKD